MTAISYQDWKNGDAIAIGRALMDGLPPVQQVARAATVLNACRPHWTPIREIERVAAIAIEPTRWGEGHDAFDDVRRLTLKEERAPTSAVLRTLLDVAEIVAKIIYNASGRPAPFDPDSPWRLASKARNFAAALNDERATRNVWDALVMTGHGEE